MNDKVARHQERVSVARATDASTERNFASRAPCVAYEHECAERTGSDSELAQFFVQTFARDSQRFGRVCLVVPVVA